MSVCPNQHQNKDDSKFCEFCGLPIVVAADTDDTVIDTDVDTDDTVIDTDVVTDVTVIDTDVVSVDTEADLANTNDNDADTDADSDDDDDDDKDTYNDDDDTDTDDNADVTDTVDTDTDTDTDDDAGDIDAVSTTSTNSSMLNELKMWAEQWDVSSDPYVSGLVSAASRNSELGMWSSLDATQMLPDMPQKETLLHRAGRAMAILRNVLVFLPVAITWEAIAKATSAYSTWDGTVPENGNEKVLQKNFLDFWSNGYGILDDRFKIQHIGILDFWIIVLIIVLSLFSSFLVSRGDGRITQLENLYDSERLSIALKIRHSLHGKREASPESIATSLADALADLNQTTRDMAEVAARLEASSTGIQALTPQLEKLNEHAGVFALQTSTAISSAVQQLVSSVDGLNNSVSSNVTSAFQNAVSSLQEVGDELKRHAVSVEYGTKLLKDDIETIRKGLQR
jgi:hypothetical protein